MSDFCDASSRDLPSEIFCMIVLIWFSDIVLLFRFSRISSNLSISISSFSWNKVSILAMRLGLLCS